MKPVGLFDRVAAFFAKEAEQSMDAKQQAVRDALGELVKAKPSTPSDAYAYAADTFDEFVIFSADLDGDGDRDLYKIAYTINADGECEFSGEPKKVKRTTTYEPVEDDDSSESKRTVSAGAVVAPPQREAPAEPAAPVESLADVELAELTLLTEKAIKSDGSALIKIIAPGWGSSGHYSKSMLERDGPKAFGAGTKMYLDHPTKTEERERPERSVTNLAAEITGTPTYLEGAKAPRGDGLYAPAKVFTAHREMLEDLAPHIGVSIRALGRASAKPVTIEGRTGPAIEQLVAAKSVDFVTEPGAGGEIVSLFESARGGGAYQRKKEVAAPSAGKETTVTENTTDLAAMRKELDELKEANRKRDAREQGADIMRTAREFAVAETAKIRLPGFVRERIVDEVCADPPTKDGALDREAFAKKITEAARDEAAYLVRATGRGSIKGLGTSITETTTDVVKENEAAEKSLKESFRSLGLTEKMADAAVAVRH